jgi:hypothetical protein
MLEIGFELKGNQFFHPRSVYYVEFPPGPLAIGNDYSVQPIILPVPGGALLGLSATDSCRDRLAAYFHFHDRQGLRAAIAIAVRNRVDLGVIRSWSIVERSLEKFELFVQEVDRVRRRRRTKRRPAQSRSAKRSRK